MLTTDQHKLFLDHYSQVRIIAKKLKKYISTSIMELDDLISYGSIGLIDAIQKHNPHISSLKHYANIRIKGSIIDGLRSESWTPRSIIDKRKDLENLIIKLQSKNKSITPKTISKKLNITINQYHDLMNEIKHTELVPINNFINSDQIPKETDNFSNDNNMISYLDKTSTLPILEDLKIDSPLNRLILKNVRMDISKAIKSLSNKTQYLLMSYYFENKTLASIGKKFNVLEPAAWQMLMKALQFLRIKLKKHYHKKMFQNINLFNRPNSKSKSFYKPLPQWIKCLSNEIVFAVDEKEALEIYTEKRKIQCEKYSFPSDFEKAYIYECSRKRVTGYITCEKILHVQSYDLLQYFKKKLDLDLYLTYMQRKSIAEYYKGRTKATIIYIKESVEFESCISLKDINVKDGRYLPCYIKQ